MNEKVTFRKGYLKNGGLEDVRKGNIDAGIEKYKAYLEVPGNEQDDDAWACLGGAHRRKEDITNALKYYRKAFEVNPASTYAIVNIICLAAAARDQECVNYYLPTAKALTEKAISGDDADHWTWFDKATIQPIEGSIDEAVSDFRFGADMKSCSMENVRSAISNLEFLHKFNPELRERIDRVLRVFNEYIG
jgi:tetratricopeptide (TPR) repeat protein